VFAAGAVTAGAAVFLLATPSGKKMRQQIASFVAGEVEAVTAKARAVEHRVEEAMGSDSQAARQEPNGARPGA
jgi:hypothetical protein